MNQDILDNIIDDKRNAEWKMHILMFYFIFSRFSDTWWGTWNF